MEVRPDKRFSAPVEQALRESGWFPCRAVRRDLMRSWLAFRWPSSSGYQCIFPSAYQVLQEFGDLHIQQPADDRGMNFNPIRIDPLKVVHEEDVDSWIHYEWQLNDRLFPLGIQNEGGSWVNLLIGNGGRIYSISGVSGEFFLVGETFDQALEALVLKLPVVRLGVPDEIQEANEVATALHGLYATGSARAR